MHSRPDFCPGCGAQVYPEEVHCPFCGRSLRSSPWFPFLMGVGGMAAVLIVGALVWWVLDALPPSVAAAPDATQQEATAQPSAPATALATPAQPALGQDVAGANAAGGAVTPAVVVQGADVAPDASASATGSAVASAAPGDVSEEQLPLPTLKEPPAATPADIAARKEFATGTQQRFTENGLDLTVETSGDDATVLMIKFNFPAKTAAELIVAGPFPHQCIQRGFKQVVFVDPSGTSWLYDLATQQMTQR